MENHLLKILSSLIVKFSDVQAENFYFQVKFINCYLREVISFTKKIDIRDWGQSTVTYPVVLMVGSDICDCDISWSYLLVVVFSTLLAR